jgi:hypothetical protein
MQLFDLVMEKNFQVTVAPDSTASVSQGETKNSQILPGTERWGWDGRRPVQISAPRPANMAEAFRGFPQSIQYLNLE